MPSSSPGPATAQGPVPSRSASARPGRLGAVLCAAYVSWMFPFHAASTLVQSLPGDLDDGTKFQRHTVMATAGAFTAMCANIAFGLLLLQISLPVEPFAARMMARPLLPPRDAEFLRALDRASADLARPEPRDGPPALHAHRPHWAVLGTGQLPVHARPDRHRPETFVRTPKQSTTWLSAIVRTRALPLAS